MSLRIALYSLLLFCNSLSAQKDSLRARKIVLCSGTALVGAGSLVGLNQLWYKPYSTGKFHFFNDNKEWLQVDKVGHTYTCYQSARLLMGGFEKAGFNKKQTMVYGGGAGFLYMTMIEVMDGYSSGWGYSWGDQFADAFGSALAIAQYAAWKEQRIQLKFSFAKSGLAKYNPNLLGSSFNEQLLKDYNGQTYWLSVNPSSFITKENRFPKWLNICVGYAGYGMLGGHENKILAQDPDGTVWKVERERRYYLSVDVDLSRLPIKNKTLKSICSWIQLVKIPAPALQFSNKGVRAYGLYF